MPNDEEVTRLYGGQVTLSFNPKVHRYDVDGVEVDGVTTILGSAVAKPALVPWAVKMAREYVSANLKAGVALDEFQIDALLDGITTAHRKKTKGSADIGSFVHNWISDFILGKSPEMPVNVEVRKCIDAFFEWVKLHEVSFVSSERKIYSRKHNYAGTYDALAYVDGKMSVLDLKTGSGVYPEMGLQLAAYHMAHEEEFPEQKIEKRIIVNIRKDGTLEEKEFSDHEAYNDGFLAAITIHRLLRKR